jgi:hypothetical protein
MDSFRALQRADRAEQPVHFWINVVLNLGWLLGGAATLFQMAINGGL